MKLRVIGGPVHIAAASMLLALTACSGDDETPAGKTDGIEPPTDTSTTDLPLVDPLPDVPLEVCINEVWADGVRGPAEAVELFAPGGAVDLTGWRISDDPNRPHLGMLLDGRTVPASGALLVDDLLFGLDADGESVVLLAPDGRGTVVSWEDAPTDASASRRTDCCTGADCWTWDWLGSPGASNGMAWRDLADPWTDEVPTADGRLYSWEWEVADPLAVEQLTLEVEQTGPFLVRLNGVEVDRVGLSSTDPAVSLGPSVPSPTRVVLHPSQLLPGPNLLQIETIGATATAQARLIARGSLPPSPAPEQPRGVVSEEDVPPPGDRSDALFSQDRIHTIDLTMTPDAFAELDGEPGVYVEADVVVDGYAVGTIGVKRRGKLGSLRPMTDKPKLRLDLNRFVAGGELWGQQSLQLNSAVQDCAFVREPMGYAVFGAAGRPAPREGYARLVLNGEDYGQYYLLEDIDDRFLARWYDDPGGTLYDGSYVEENGNPLAMTDFSSSQVHRFDLESGPDIGGADLLAVQLGLDAWEAGTLDVAGVGALVDWPAWHTHLAVEEWVGHTDGYILMPNNYWVYFDPNNTRAAPLPWDTDQVFLHDWQWFTTTWSDPDGRLAALCHADPACLAEQGVVMATVIADLDAADLVATLDRLELLSLQGTLDDPKRECDEGSLFATRADVRRWLEVRSDEMRVAWGL